MVLSTLRQIMRAIDIRSRQLSKSVGLTGPQLIVLSNVAAADYIPIGRLAHQVSLSQATVTSIVDRLESRQLIRRHRTDPDRRKVLLEITPEGREILDRSPTVLQEEFVEAFEALEPWEQTQILSTLQRVSKMMNAHKIPEAPLLDTHEAARPGES